MLLRIPMCRAPLALSGVALAALLLAGCDKTTPTVVAAAPAVGVYTLHAQNITLTTDLPGRTTPWRIAEVRPQVSGVVQKRLFTEGTDVKAGQQLYQIDDAPYRATYQKAIAALNTAQQLAQRDEKLLIDHAVSKQQTVDAEAVYQQAVADVDSAKINLQYTKVYAPISGHIGSSAVTEGALVTTGQASAMATVQQLDPIYVDVTQSSVDMLRLREALANGQLQRSSAADQAEVSLQLEDGSTYPLRGSLKFSEVSVDPTTGSVMLRAVFPNPNNVLLPGMFVHAQLSQGVKNQALLVPEQAVQHDTTGSAIAWVIGKDDKAQLRHITTDRTVGNTWLVSAGLNDGDQVVTEGLQRMIPGIDVQAAAAQNVHLQLGDSVVLASASANNGNQPSTTVVAAASAVAGN